MWGGGGGGGGSVMCQHEEVVQYMYHSLPSEHPSFIFTLGWQEKRGADKR